MSTDRVLALVALIVAAAALGVAAIAWVDDNDRDACARLADLSAAVAPADRSTFFAAIVQDEDVSALLDDCVKG